MLVIAVLSVAVLSTGAMFLPKFPYKFVVSISCGGVSAGDVFKQEAGYFGTESRGIWHRGAAGCF